MGMVIYHKRRLITGLSFIQANVIRNIDENNVKMKEKKHRAKRIGKGHYQYRGFDIICVGYYGPEHRVAWECVDENDHGFGQGFSLRECKMWVDAELDS